jgi:hypothetical protein
MKAAALRGALSVRASAGRGTSCVPGQRGDVCRRRSRAARPWRAVGAPPACSSSSYPRTRGDDRHLLSLATTQRHCSQATSSSLRRAVSDDSCSTQCGVRVVRDTGRRSPAAPCATDSGRRPGPTTKRAAVKKRTAARATPAEKSPAATVERGPQVVDDEVVLRCEGSAPARRYRASEGDVGEQPHRDHRDYGSAPVVLRERATGSARPEQAYTLLGTRGPTSREIHKIAVESRSSSVKGDRRELD